MNIINIMGEIFFFKHHAEDEAERLVPDLFFLFKKMLYVRPKQVVSTLVSKYYCKPLTWTIYKNTRKQNIKGFRKLIQRYA